MCSHIEVFFLNPDIGRAGRFPALSRLMAAGRREYANQTIEVALCRRLGVARQTDWPLAPFVLLGEEGLRDHAYWLQADPVHLVLQRDHFILSCPVPLALFPDEAESLLVSLNRHFEQEGLYFHCSPSGRWYLRLERSPEMATCLSGDAAGQDIRACMPQGAGAARWNRLLNEMQMLLFAHPVNQAREAAHLPAVNSIWLSGGGILPAGMETGYRGSIYGEGLARGIARLASLPVADLPDDAEAFLRQPAGEALLVLESVEDADRRWFLPLLTALKKGTVRQLALSFSLGHRVLSVQVRPLDLWKFWRKASLESCFPVREAEIE